MGSWILISEGLLMFNLIWSAFWIPDSCYLILMYIAWEISPGLLCWVKINNNNGPLFKGMGCRTIFFCSRLISRDFCQTLPNFMAALKSQKTFYSAQCCWRSAFRRARQAGEQDCDGLRTALSLSAAGETERNSEAEPASNATVNLFFSWSCGLQLTAWKEWAWWVSQKSFWDTSIRQRAVERGSGPLSGMASRRYFAHFQ